MRHYVLGLPLDVVSLADATQWVLEASGMRGGVRGSSDGEARLVVTLNPEIVVQSRVDERLGAAIRHADLSVADGVGVAWAARLRGHELPGRVPGVDLVHSVLAEGGSELTVFLLGGRPGVAEAAAAKVASLYGTRVVGTHHGYFSPYESDAVCAKVDDSGAVLLLAGLGEGQERFLYEHRAQLGTRVMIGVGGTLDVLAGAVKRMPRWTSQLGVEWLFRVLLDPRRWRRVPRLWRFAWLVLRSQAL